MWILTVSILTLIQLLTKQHEQQISQNYNISIYTNQQMGKTSTDELPKAWSLSKAQKMKQASNKKAIYDHNFRESKQSVIKRKPVKMMTKPPIMRPSTIPTKASLLSIIHDMPNPVKQRRRPMKSGNWFDQSPDILSFTAPQYQDIQNIYPFSPEIPLFPFHIPYPVSAPFMPESLFQSINHQSLILPTSTVSTAVTTTRSTATLPLPVFPTLAMHPEFQNLTATPKKLKQKMVNSSRRHNCDEDFDDDDDNSRSNFRMKFD